MTSLIQATLWHQETLICEVNLFWEKDIHHVTLASKTTQKILFFEPDEQFTLRYQEGVHLHQKTIIFHEVKMLNRKPYYVFRLLHTQEEEALMEPLSALFTSETESGITTIISLHKNKVTFIHHQPLQGRSFKLTFKENNQLQYFSGQLTWAKKESKQYFYRLIST